MPLFYFHTENGTTTLDRDGVDLPDMITARDEAVGTIASILHDENLDSLWSGNPLRLWVTDQAAGLGKTLLDLRLTAN
jgi:hypothetical protein